MAFFEKLKGKFRLRNLGLSIVALCCACVAVAIAIMLILSDEARLRIALGARTSPIGITLPNEVSSLILFGVAIGCLCWMYSCIKKMIENPEYNAFLCSVQQIGDVETIGKALEETEECPYTKGDKLRVNSKVLFHMSGDKAIVIPRESIRKVSAWSFTKDNLVHVSYEETFEMYGKTKAVEKSISIRTNKTKEKKLVEYLEKVVCPVK